MTEKDIDPIILEGQREGDGVAGVDMISAAAGVTSGRPSKQQSVKSHTHPGIQPNTIDDRHFKDLVKRSQVDLLVSLYNLWRIVQAREEYIQRLEKKIDEFVTGENAPVMTTLKQASHSIFNVRDTVEKLEVEFENVSKEMKQVKIIAIIAAVFLLLSLVLSM